MLLERLVLLLEVERIEMAGGRGAFWTAYSSVKNALLCEMLVVERKMIVIQPYKSLSFSFRNRITICLLFQNGEEIPATLLPSLPSETLVWQVLRDKFSSRTVRLLSRHVPDLHCESLRERVCKISELLANDPQISVTDAEFGFLRQEGFMVARSDCRIPASTFRPTRFVSRQAAIC
jgi:hypothetical protein